MFCKNRAVLCLLALILMTSQAFASSLAGKTIRFCGDGSGWPPYTYTLADNPDQILGYDVDVVRAILAPHDIKAEFFMPSWKQCLEHSEAGNVFHVALSASFHPERDKKFLYTDSYYETEIHYFYAKSRFPKPPNVLIAADLFGYGRVCGRYSYNYEGTGVLKNDKLALIGKSFSALVSRTLSGYCTFFIARPSAIVGFGLLGKKLFTENEIEYFPVPGADKDHFYMMVSRQFPQAEELRQILNEGIARLKKSGRLQAILDGYYKQIE